MLYTKAFLNKSSDERTSLIQSELAHQHLLSDVRSSLAAVGHTDCDAAVQIHELLERFNDYSGEWSKN